MRFLADGPSIPDRLLEERDRGNVVFFCSSGVSQPLLPGFLKLAGEIITTLGTPEGAKSQKMFEQAQSYPESGPPLDQVFGALQREYGADRINDEVGKILRTPANASVEHHKIILKLSRSAVGRVQLVTTNFDLLFERADRRLKRYIPPALPDLASHQALDGIVYLHGRLAQRQKEGARRQGFVLSSADFGRAYLAEGWATRFARELLQRYVIVLLGYSASDPPVRYLLEGLHSLAGDNGPGSIYAFDAGTDDDIRERWNDRGVHAIAYTQSDGEHSSLWNTLRAWAKRADDPDAWRASIVDLARRGPRALEQHERGEVAALVRSEVGAKAFADASPPLPGEWLCVFDRRIRLAEPTKSCRSEERFDPLMAYGLDHDAAPLSPDQPAESVEDEVLSQNAGDDPARIRKSLAGTWQGWPDPLPPRLWHLARWIGRILGEPVTAWWAAGYPVLHPHLLDQVELVIERSDVVLNEVARKTWSLLLEEFRDSPHDDYDRDWYSFKSRLKKDGWTNITLREFERVVQPYVHSTRPLGRTAWPPTDGWNTARVREVVDFEIKFPGQHDQKLDVPSEHLLRVFRAVRRGLERASQLLTDTESLFFKTVTLYPEQKPGGITAQKLIPTFSGRLNCSIAWWLNNLKPPVTRCLVGQGRTNTSLTNSSYTRGANDVVFRIRGGIGHHVADR